MTIDKTTRLTDALNQAARKHDDVPAPSAPGIVGADLLKQTSPLGKPTQADPSGKQR